ncbi:ParB/RepB/Spo0J family partition protein [Hyphobacterium marinum]|uniref:ParB/RepB/Spo0J family partition protein n=1 Tax=Hyphobacterium marinum TaxID=3116574 RepID=A0ABU7LUX2_9PROT|nr:ParB/RepB/Spo0J family partition protein [Hyphobacterium sp. Y6023]MEE2565362.1 ParB/RepB/Spo0J family partition protein [Hyphobacterium sp. Y6023]
MSAERTRGLGRGLSALLSDSEGSDENTQTSSGLAGVRTLPIEQVSANPDQPRRQFSEADLTALAESIAEKGVLQPILVRPAPKGDGYQIVAGERRWRAAQRARLHEIPALVRDFTDRETLEIAIVENVQRADLDPVEEARAYRQLVDRFGHSQDEIARAVSKSRSHVANSMRLLTLPDSILTLLANGELSAGHARALIKNPDAEKLAELIVSKGLSVREAEALVKAGDSRNAPETKSRSGRSKDTDTRALEADLANRLGLAVDIRHGKGSQKEAGEIRVQYTTLEQLDDLCRRLSGSAG